MTDSYNGFTLEMEPVSKNTIFGLKMMAKSGQKIVLEFLPYLLHESAQNYKFSM